MELADFLHVQAPLCSSLCDRLLASNATLARYCAMHPCSERFCGGDVEVCINTLGRTTNS